MKNAMREGRMRWAVAAGAAVGVVGLFAFLFRAPPPALPAGPPGGAGPIVKLMRPDGTNAALDEETVLHDTTPLFLPTSRNATARKAARREPGKTFLDKETTRLEFSGPELDLVAGLPPVVTLNGKLPAKAGPVDALTADVPGQFLLGFGRVDEPSNPQPARGAYVEVVAMASGRRILAESLPVAAQPDTAKPWQPMEFFASVDAAGLTRPLMVTEGSQVEEVDAYFRNFLGRTYRIGERLPPGFYRIVVGP